MRVGAILFGMIRDHCERLGLREGSLVTGRARSQRWMLVELPSGTTVHLPREYTWFVSVMDP